MYKKVLTVLILSLKLYIICNKIFKTLNKLNSKKYKPVNVYSLIGYKSTLLNDRSFNKIFRNKINYKLSGKLFLLYYKNIKSISTIVFNEVNWFIS